MTLKGGADFLGAEFVSHGDSLVSLFGVEKMCSLDEEGVARFEHVDGIVFASNDLVSLSYSSPSPAFLLELRRRFFGLKATLMWRQVDMLNIFLERSIGGHRVDVDGVFRLINDERFTDEDYNCLALSVLFAMNRSRWSSTATEVKKLLGGVLDSDRFLDPDVSTNCAEITFLQQALADYLGLSTEIVLTDLCGKANHHALRCRLTGRIVDAYRTRDTGGFFFDTAEYEGWCDEKLGDAYFCVRPKM